MYRIATLSLITLLCYTQFLHAQAPVIEWQKCFGSRYDADIANAVLVTSDGGFIMAGYTSGIDDGDVLGYHGAQGFGDIWIVKTDSKGTLQWQKCLGGDYFETGASILQTSDGGYILAGTEASVGCNFPDNHGSSADFWVVKLTAVGDIEWQKAYGGSNTDGAYSIDFASDGGYIVAGFAQSTDDDVTQNHGNRDYWIIKIDAAGNLKWQKSLGGSGDDEIWSMKATPDGGCVATGFTQSSDGNITGYHGNTDEWVVKLDKDGNLQWQRALGGSSYDEGWSIQLTSDGGYIVAGVSGSNDGDVSGNHASLGAFRDFWVVKLSNAGNIQWQKCYGGSLNETAYFILPTSDGGYLVTGQAESSDGDLNCNLGFTDEWIIKIDNAGNLQWQKNMGGSLYDEAYCIRPLSDGGYIVAGGVGSPDVKGYHDITGPKTVGDFWLVKLSAPVVAAPNPVVSIDPVSANICAGTSATLIANALYAGTNPVYHWTRNGVAVGADSSTYTASDFANNDVVACTITSGGGCNTLPIQASDAVTIKLKTGIINTQISIAADNTVVCSCNAITFKATTKNTGASPVYIWKVNGHYSGNNSPVFTTKTLVAGDVVTCTYMDKTDCILGGAAVSNSITLKQGITVPPTVIVTYRDNNFCAGDTAKFVAIYTDAGDAPIFQWKINGLNVGPNKDTFTTTSLRDGDLIRCDITTDPLFACAGTSTSSSNLVVVNVYPLQTPLITIAATSNVICAGGLASFNVSDVHAGNNPSYQWQVNGINAGANSNIFSISSLKNGDVVSCLASVDPQWPCPASRNVMSNSVVMTINKGTPPSILISASDSDVCYGTPITFTAAVQNAGASPNYEWKINNVDAGNSTSMFTGSKLSNGDELSCVVVPDNTSCSTSPVSSNIINVRINYPPSVNISPADTIIK
ncbi:MAG: hypothetical protein ACHQF0_06155, partial [Chitinophagales bacterium]